MLDFDGPTIVEVIRACKSLGALPQPGGLFDQDSLFVHMVSVYDAAVAERRDLDTKRTQARQQRKQ